MVGSIWLEGIISQQSQINERAAMESATAIATEAIIAIRTVQSLGISVYSFIMVLLHGPYFCLCVCTTCSIFRYLIITCMIFVGVEKKFLTKFQESLATSNIALAKKSRWRGLVMGSGVYIPFLSFSVAIVYGVTLIAYEGVPFSTVWL